MKFIVDLDKEENAELIALTQKGRPSARKIKRANILLLADAGKPDLEITELLHTSWLAVFRAQHKFCRRRSEQYVKRTAAGRVNA